MRLINTSTLELEYFVSSTSVPSYAILSHRWGDGELSLQDFAEHSGREKIGFKKIRFTCDEARDRGIDYAWVDTVCIDKQSSAELSESINSMWTWYKNATICYVYLEDVQLEDIVKLNEKRHSNTGTAYNLNDAILPDTLWTTRGWTLQELLAPREVEFYTMEWHHFGTRTTLASALARQTRIDVDYPQGRIEIEAASIAERMSWASSRDTTRLEDAAYCLLGIFGVNMPLLYGEGEKAFIRLQEEILRISDDESIFAWTDPTANQHDVCGLLAKAPSFFRESADFQPYRDWTRRTVPAVVSSLGISLDVQLRAYEWGYTAHLRCKRKGSDSDVAICVRMLSQESGQCSRLSPSMIMDWPNDSADAKYENISIRQQPVKLRAQDILPYDKWCSRFAVARGSQTSYQLLSASHKGGFRPDTHVNLLIPGGQREFGHAFIVQPIGSGDIIVLVGSGTEINPRTGYRMGAFSVIDLETLGNPCNPTTISKYIEANRGVLAAAFQPAHHFGETLIFKGLHQVTFKVMLESRSGRQWCTLIVRSHEPDKSQATAVEQAKPAKETKPSLLRRMVQGNKNHVDVAPKS